MIKGKLVYLDSIEKEDLSQLQYWRNLTGYRKNFREYREISNDMQMKWYQSKALNDPSTIMFAIRDLKSHELLGCCGLCYINWVNRNADLSLYVGWNESYIDDVGFAFEASQLLFKYGFYELGLHKIWSEIYEFDELKLKLYNQLGLKRDGILRSQYYNDGKWWNSYIFSLLYEEFVLEQ